jgi:serine phosphatase RsbU (regulator of sigma subunit)
MMGQLRATARAYAALDLPPDEVLARLDDLVRGMDDPEQERLVTCVYATYDPGSPLCCIANAGHLPPVGAGTSTELVTQATGVPLGVGGVEFSSYELTLLAGQALVLYTDGLVENRRRDLDTGIGELRSATTSRRAATT